MGKLNIDAMKQKLEEESQSTSRGNNDYDKLQNGKNIRRILWPKGDKESFYSEGYVHYGLGEDGHTMVTCPHTWGSKEPCPICEYVEELQQSSSKDDKKLASDLRARRRIYVNVIDRDGDSEQPKILGMGVTILKGILQTICDPDYGDITDYETGRDITITRKGQGLSTEYSVLPKPRETLASEDMSEEELEDAMADLDALFVRKSYDELKAILAGDDYDDDEDEDSSDEYDEMDLDDLIDECDDRGIAIPRKPTRIKLIALLTQDDQAEDDDEDEEEEEEPVKPARKRKAAIKDEDEGDDEDDDDEVSRAIKDAIAKRNRRK